MYSKILVGYDGSDQAEDALALGKQLADATGAGLVVGGVFQFDPIWGGRDPRFREAEMEYATKIEAAAEAVGAAAEAFPSSSPARGLHELAEELEADLVLVGSAHHGRVGQILAGSVGVALLQGAPCAIGIAPRGYRERAGDGIASVVAGFDGSSESGLALLAAIQLASGAGATLKLVSVAEPPPRSMGKGGDAGRLELTEAIQAQAREWLLGARDMVPAGIVVEATLITGDPVESLVNVAEAPGTLLVVGSRAFGPVRRVLLGSVSTELVRFAPSPMIVTPRPLVVSPRGIHDSPNGQRGAEVATAS